MEFGGFAGADDDLAGLDLEPLAAARSAPSASCFAAENLGEPVAQVGLFLREPLMLRDDLVLAPFERVIEFRRRS